MLPLVPLVIGRGAITVGAAAKARSRSVYHRLGFAVETIAVGDDETVEECLVAERIAGEGPALIADACRRRGSTTPVLTPIGQPTAPVRPHAALSRCPRPCSHTER